MAEYAGGWPDSACSFLTERFRPERFERGGEVTAYLGLAPFVRHSGEKTPAAKIRPIGQIRLRSLLVEAARQWYTSLLQQNAPKYRSCSKGHNRRCQETVDYPLALGFGKTRLQTSLRNLDARDFLLLGSDKKWRSFWYRVVLCATAANKKRDLSPVPEPIAQALAQIQAKKHY
ncbi:transposase [Desulfovibrio fairfieldensis]|uniref:transposase n=1 Tax=Desulfovibrio fairfieldensis TaxID=44742 RepID=UPI0009FA2F4B